VTVTPLTAERVRQILSLVGTIKRNPKPVLKSDTEIDLQLDRLFARLRRGKL